MDHQLKITEIEQCFGSQMNYNKFCGSKNGKSEPQKSFWLINESQGKLKQNCKKQVRPTIALRGLPLDDMKSDFRQSRLVFYLGQLQRKVKRSIF